MTPAPVFYCEPTGRVRRYLRRYRTTINGERQACPLMAGEYSYHHAMVVLDEADAVRDAEGVLKEGDDWPPNDDPRWPRACACGFAFDAGDDFQRFQRQLYRRTDSGAVDVWEDMPIGAVRDCDWLKEYRASWIGEDGRILEVVIPHERGKTTWIIDSRCSSCTLPNDDEHRCWVRHGKPEDGTLHVDKNGKTCSAGGGSIVVPGFHGFLHSGRIVAC